LAGRHQLENLSLALAAAELLMRQGVALGCDVLRQGVAAVRWPGRLEWLPDRVLLDGAHNPAGAEVLGNYLLESGLDRVHWIAGLKADKDAEEILAPLLPHIGRIYACRPPVEKAVPPQKLAELAGSAGVSAEVFASPEQALDAALEARGADETILVAGSLFLVAVLRERLLSVQAGQDMSAEISSTGP